MTVTLYDDQIDLVTRVRTSMRSHRSVLMQASTGAGKTRMSLNMIEGAYQKGSTAIFTVPRKELLAQTIETFAGYGIPFGVIASGYTPNPMAKIQLAMTPTLARRLDKTAPPSVIFIDECHYGGADLDRVIDWSKASGGWRVGLSATPMKTNGRGMGDWYEHMECGLPVCELIRRKRLSDFRYFAASTPDLSRLTVRNGEYVQSQVAEFMEQHSVLIGDAVRTYRENAIGKLNVVFATSRKHAGMIVDKFRDDGIAAQMIDGTMDAATRKRIILGFARREFTVLVNVMLLTFGFDLAQAAGMDVTVEAMSDLNPTKSLPMQMQKWGRVLRMKSEPAVILDHANNWREHGFPDDPREWKLEGADKRGGGGGGGGSQQRQCEVATGGCGFVARLGPSCCPNCGMMYPVQSRMVEEEDGELIEIDRTAMVRERKMEQGQAQTLDDLIRVGMQRGMKNPRGWAMHVMKGRKRK